MKCTISGGLPVKSTASARRMALNAALSNKTFGFFDALRIELRTSVMLT
jgi:hypothetical protein